MERAMPFRASCEFRFSASVEEALTISSRAGPGLGNELEFGGALVLLSKGDG